MTGVWGRVLPELVVQGVNGGMRLIYILLGLLVAMIFLLIHIAGLPEPSASTGMAHPLIEHMRVGGDGLKRFVEVGPPAFIMQIVVLVLSMLLVVMGISERRRDGTLYWWVGICGVVSLVNWYMVYSTYQAFLISGETGFFLGFPVPSAWMIYGTWLSGLLLVAFYILGFRRFIFTDEDEAEYLALVSEVQASNQPESGGEQP